MSNKASKIFNILAVMVSLALAITLAGCSKTQDKESEREKYELSNGYLPTEVQDILKKAILNIYMPGSDEDIAEGVDMLAPLSTEFEINELKNTVGKYDENKRVIVKDINVSIAMPENTTDKRMQYLVTFTINNDEQSMEMMLQFNCNDDGFIKSHSIWTR